jgi:hypothetical protein
VKELRLTVGMGLGKAVKSNKKVLHIKVEG